VKDWNDALRAGVNIREIGDSAKPWTPKGNGKDQDDLGFNLICLADVDPVPIDWIWEGHLARGKLTLIGGDPDLGKSLLCTDAAARLSRGAHWPRGARANIGGTIFICSEDSTADTIRPRVEAAGADLSMLQVFKSTLTTKDGKRKTFSLQEDLDVLGAAITKAGNVSLVCVDAITSYMGTKIDSHQTSHVRSVLEPVAEFAEQHKVAILGVTHPPKAAQGNALRSFTGSFAFIAAPRVAFIVTTEPETKRRLLLCVKNNIGQKALGLGYYLGIKAVTNDITAPYVLWDDAPVDVNADQAIAAASAALKEGDALAEAKAFLREILANGQRQAKDVEDTAINGHLISERTLRRACKELKIKKHKVGLEGGWLWELP
jgi:putative DNA primase/helicase